jgi:hypothetical protein
VGAGGEGVGLHRRRGGAVPHHGGESAAAGGEVPAAGAVLREMVLRADTPLDGDVKEKIARQLDKADGRLAVLTGEDETC